jgi:hypothetical protein
MLEVNMPVATHQPSTTVQGVSITREEVLRAMDRFDVEIRATYPSTKWKK